MRELLIIILGYGKMLAMFLVGMLVMVSVLAIITKFKNDSIWLSRFIHKKVIS